MFNSMKNTRALGLLAILLFAVAIAPSAQSLPYGVSGVENDGCSCHGQSASSEVVPSIEGLPDELEAEIGVRSVESGCRWGSWRSDEATHSRQSQHTRMLRSVVERHGGSSVTVGILGVAPRKIPEFRHWKKPPTHKRVVPLARRKRVVPLAASWLGPCAQLELGCRLT